MDKSESSDSDSNSSTSWVFVYDNTPPPEHTNTFHLDCSREPIQELTEQDLLSTCSDFESDTDGVSVISESEGIQEDFEQKSCEVTSDLHNDDTENCETLTGHIFDLHNKSDKPVVTESKKLFFKNTNIVGVGVVLTAVFLGSYTLVVKRDFIKDTDDIQDFIIYDDTKIDSNFLCKSDIGIHNHLDEIVDLTIACTYGDQNKNVGKHKQIKQCVKMQYETKKYLKEIQASDSSTKEQENLPHITDTVKKDVDKPLLNKVYSQWNDNKKDVSYLDEITNKEHKEIQLNETPSYYVSNYNKTRKIKNKNNEKVKKKIKDKKPALHNENKKGDKRKRKDNNKINKKDPDNRKRAKYEKSQEKYESHTKNPKKVYKNKFESSKRSYEVKFKHNKRYDTKKNSTSKEYKDLNSSGEWYGNWHKARQQLRKHNTLDEHYLSGKKKYKMQWYFKWMGGREELRYKKSYRPYSS